MSDDGDLDVDVLAAMLRSDAKESGDYLELVAVKLEGALPNHVVVERSGWFSKKVVSVVKLELDKAHYTLKREKHGPVAHKARIVRGVQLSMTELSLEDWSREVAAAIKKLAEASADTRDALEKFVKGSDL